MRARLAATAFLLVIAIALPVAAVMKNGVPWGYRGHAAVILEATGAVELSASDAKRLAEGGADVVMKASPGVFLDVGDEVRVGRYSEARLRLPAGDVVLGDDARVLVSDKGLKLLRGLVDVVLPVGTSPFEVQLPSHDGQILLRSGPEGGSFRVVADGKLDVRAFVRSGSAEAVAAGDAHAETGQIVAVDHTRVPRVIPAAEAAAPFAPVATCDNKAVTIDVPPATQVIALRQLRYPDKGKAAFELKEVKPAVPVFARDVAGRVWRAAVPCAGAP